MAKKSQKTEKQEEIKDQEVVEETAENQDEMSVAHEEEQEPTVEEKTKEEELGEKLAELQDKYLRLSAEYDNYRKRTLREKMDLQEGAREDIFVNILPVVDDLERALEVVQSAKDLEAVKLGMQLIHTKFSNYLTQQGIKPIDAIDKEFNTDLHEAVTKIPVESKKKKGKVVDVVEKGYTLRDKVIRFAKVVIGE
ncbi:MAG: nucleotide exchange factor GrpE [Bacteroidales bacterium]|nr:nucleotide exchange factor GrpE [Bacteroidales bacterium]MDT8432442.1 nucleotide exchange factor GrpE [Bacteroidales bacterium]